MNSSAFLLSISSALHTSDKQLVAVQIQGVPASTHRQPVHLVFVIDTSDSMNDFVHRGGMTKLDKVKKSIEFILPLLHNTDEVSLITFGDTSNTLFEHVKTDEVGKQDILHAVQNIRTNGCTNMSAGLMAAMATLEQRNNKPGVFLLTDGHTNMGISSIPGLNNIVERMREQNSDVTLTTIGYGESHNAELLRSMGTTGGGSYNVVNSLEGVATTFGEVLGGLTSVVAQNVVVTLPQDAIPITGYPIINGNTIRIGDIYAENEITILFYKSQEDAVVSVKGGNMITMTNVNETIDVVEEGTTESAVLAFYRYHVSKMLQEIALHSNQTPSDRVRNCLEELRALPNSTLVQMMIDDLEKATSNHMNSVHLIQHAAYLSLGRGLRSHDEPYDHNVNNIVSSQNNSGSDIEEDDVGSGGLFGDDSDDDYTSGNPTHVNSVQRAQTTLHFVNSPFSNRRQQEHLTTLRSATSQYIGE